MAIRPKTKMTIKLAGRGTSHSRSEAEIDGNTVVIDEPVARGGDEGREPDGRRPGRALDDDAAAARRERAGRLGLREHGQRDAVLARARRVRLLALGEDRAAAELRERVERQQRRRPDELRLGAVAPGRVRRRERAA